MHTIHTTNVNQALSRALGDLLKVGELRSSRNGTVLAFPEPVSTVYTKPTQRVLFSSIRNANPTFHLLESLWMLAGRNDVKFPSTIVRNMKSYTDDGKTYWGAYGYRWRNFFGWDQIETAIQELRRNPESRRVVVQMWTPNDLVVGIEGGKDVPCNTSIYFDLRGGRLNMLVSCRSNDILWGAYGANAVHMSVLMEYVALSVGVPVGIYTQMSNDLHLYNATVPKEGVQALAEEAARADWYRRGYTHTLPLWGEGESRDMFDQDLRRFFHGFDTMDLDYVAVQDYDTLFFQNTVRYMLRAWLSRKSERVGLHNSYKIASPDWALAMTKWIHNLHKGK